MKIMPKTNADYKAIVGIAKSLPQWFTKGRLRQIKYATKKQHGLVAIENNHVVGFIFYRKWRRTSYLTWMGVTSSEKRKGIGSKLLAATEVELRKNKVDEIRVSTLSRAVKYKPYEETRIFYEKRGFILHHTDRNFYPNGGDRETLLKKLTNNNNKKIHI